MTDQQQKPPSPAARRFAEEVADAMELMLLLNRDEIVQWLAPILDRYVSHREKIKEIEETHSDLRDRVLITLYHSGGMNPEALAQAIFPDLWQNPDRRPELTAQIDAVLAALAAEGLIALNKTEADE